MSNVKKNFFYNIIYQILILILPLITSPYIARTIGAEGQGIFSYTYSIAQYFMLFAMLGLSNYGNRTIAQNKENKDQLSTEFWSIYIMQITTTTIAVIAYVIYIILFVNNYKLYSIIQLIYIISAFFDINWFFFGIEKFKLTVTRNIIIKVLSVICIFIFVKDKNNLVLYTIIMILTTFISQISLWPYLKKEIFFKKVNFKDVIKHIKPNIILFIPIIAISIYKIMDKIMLGNMTNIENVGYYENAEKIINIPLSFITALGTVMLPRASNLISNGNKEKVINYINKSIKFVMFISIPLAFGLMAIGDNFSIIFFGKDFITTGYIVQYLSFTIVFIAWANVIRTQYLIPNNLDKIYIVSVFLGAIINIIINLLLIPKYNSIGAAIGTLFAEFIVMAYQTYKVREELTIKKYVQLFLNFFIKGMIMYVIIKLLEVQLENKVILLVTQIIVGGFIYIILNYKYILENIHEISFFDKFKIINLGGKK